MTRKYSKPNWKKVEIGLRDERLIKTIGDEGFVRRDFVIKYIFEGKESYAKIRIRKLKKFGYLKTVSVREGDPESYLLGQEGIDVVRGFYPIGLRGWGCPSVLESIDLATYDHSLKVTRVRLIFENLGFCKNWKSERLLRAGTKGGHKVPDGFFIPNEKGIAVEVELTPKKDSTYRKIFEVYDHDSKMDYVLYICGSLSLLTRLRRLIKKMDVSKGYCFMLYDELVRSQENAMVRIQDTEFPLKKLLS